MLVNSLFEEELGSNRIELDHELCYQRRCVVLLMICYVFVLFMYFPFFVETCLPQPKVNQFLSPLKASCLVYKFTCLGLLHPFFFKSKEKTLLSFIAGTYKQ